MEGWGVIRPPEKRPCRQNLDCELLVLVNFTSRKICEQNL